MSKYTELAQQHAQMMSQLPVTSGQTRAPGLMEGLQQNIAFSIKSFPHILDALREGMGDENTPEEEKRMRRRAMADAAMLVLTSLTGGVGAAARAGVAGLGALGPIAERSILMGALEGAAGQVGFEAFEKPEGEANLGGAALFGGLGGAAFAGLAGVGGRVVGRAFKGKGGGAAAPAAAGATPAPGTPTPEVVEALAGLKAKLGPDHPMVAELEQLANGGTRGASKASPGRAKALGVLHMNMRQLPEFKGATPDGINAEAKYAFLSRVTGRKVESATDLSMDELRSAVSQLRGKLGKPSKATGSGGTVLVRPWGKSAVGAIAELPDELHAQLWAGTTAESELYRDLVKRIGKDATKPGGRFRAPTFQEAVDLMPETVAREAEQEVARAVGGVKPQVPAAAAQELAANAAAAPTTVREKIKAVAAPKAPKIEARVVLKDGKPVGLQVGSAVFRPGEVVQIAGEPGMWTIQSAGKSKGATPGILVVLKNQEGAGKRVAAERLRPQDWVPEVTAKAAAKGKKEPALPGFAPERGAPVINPKTGRKVSPVKGTGRKVRKALPEPQVQKTLANAILSSKLAQRLGVNDPGGKANQALAVLQKAKREGNPGLLDQFAEELAYPELAMRQSKKTVFSGARAQEGIARETFMRRVRTTLRKGYPFEPQSALGAAPKATAQAVTAASQVANISGKKQKGLTTTQAFNRVRSKSKTDPLKQLQEAPEANELAALLRSEEAAAVEAHAANPVSPRKLEKIASGALGRAGFFNAELDAKTLRKAWEQGPDAYRDQLAKTLEVETNAGRQKMQRLLKREIAVIKANKTLSPEARERLLQRAELVQETLDRLKGQASLDRLVGTPRRQSANIVGDKGGDPWIALEIEAIGEGKSIRAFPQARTHDEAVATLTPYQKVLSQGFMAPVAGRRRYVLKENMEAVKPQTMIEKIEARTKEIDARLEELKQETLKPDISEMGMKLRAAEAAKLLTERSKLRAGL